MKKIINNKGASVIILVASIVCVLGIAALVLDIGETMLEKEKLSSAVDAVALASIQDIDKDDQRVRDTAKYYAQLNGIDPSELFITIAQDRKSLTVESSKNVQFYFAKVLGFNQETVNALSIVKIAPLTAFKGVRPLVVVDQVFEYNKLYVLKEDAGDGESGNYGVVALGGNGASIYRDNLLNGYSKILRVGDELYTETGNISNTTRQCIQELINSDPYSTYTNFNKNSSRLIIIPIVNTLDLSGKKPIKVVGFAAFFLEGLAGNGGHTEIVGRFVRYIADGDCSDYQTDYGVKGIKLIR